MVGMQEQRMFIKRKNLDSEQRLSIAKPWDPLDETSIKKAKFYHPGPNSPEARYLNERRAAHGGNSRAQNNCASLKRHLSVALSLLLMARATSRSPPPWVWCVF